MKKTVSCPHCCTYPRGRPARVVSRGVFRRSTNPRPIRRYLCLGCGRSFSEATLSPEYRQKRRDINLPLFKLLVSTVSMRRASKILSINRKTVDRRLPYFAKVANEHQAEMLKHRSPCHEVQFDDVETSEHTKLKPLSIPMVVEHPNRVILAFDVAQMPAKGLLAEISVKKYGRRRDLRHIAWRSVLTTVASTSVIGVKVTSDSHPRYPDMIRRYLPRALHIQTISRRACVAGQGELKRGGHDPLFSFNHTAAMLRANINRLIRRTWCTTKRRDRLRMHIATYVLWHNEVILARIEGRPARFHFEGLV